MRSAAVGRKAASEAACVAFVVTKMVRAQNIPSAPMTELPLSDLEQQIQERLTWHQPRWGTLQAMWPEKSESTFFRTVRRVRKRVEAERARRQRELDDPLVSAQRRRDPIQLCLDLELAGEVKACLDIADDLASGSVLDGEIIQPYWQDQSFILRTRALHLWVCMEQVFKRAEDNYLWYEWQLFAVFRPHVPNFDRKIPYRRRAIVPPQYLDALWMLIGVLRDAKLHDVSRGASKVQKRRGLKARMLAIEGLLGWADGVLTKDLVIRLSDALAEDLVKIRNDKTARARARYVQTEFSERIRAERAIADKAIATDRRTRQAEYDRKRRLARKRDNRHDDPGERLVANSPSLKNENGKAATSSLAGVALARSKEIKAVAYDIIGDVHGQATKLRALLSRLGYSQARGLWKHPERSAIFVGDLIDRGPEQLETLQIVRRMVDEGHARCIMGNHELNAIGYATQKPGKGGDWLRSRNGSAGARHAAQHGRFLAEVGLDSTIHQEWIGWFKGLPLWIDEPGFRVVHACWHGEAITYLQNDLGPDITAPHKLLVNGMTPGTIDFWALEQILKGPELELPHGVAFVDKDGVERRHGRLAWWNTNAQTYEDALLPYPGVTIPPTPLDFRDVYSEGSKPTFVGHYWRDWRDLRILSDHVACVDFSAGGDGPLVAYRFDGETRLDSNKFWATQSHLAP